MNDDHPIDRLNSLIDALLKESDVSSSALASMLTAARDSIRDGYHVALALRVWEASNALKDQYLYAAPLAESSLLAESLAETFDGPGPGGGNVGWSGIGGIG